MKKLTLTIVMVILAISLTAPAVMAGYLPPLSCNTAAELGWKSWGWNTLCLYELEYNCCDPMGDPWY